MRALLLSLVLAPAALAQGGPGVRVFAEGYAHYSRGELDEAIPHWRQAADEVAGIRGDAPRTYRAWLGEALRREGQRAEDVALVEEAVAVARGVLAEGACHAHAHLVLADAYDDQAFDWPGASADSTAHHLERAVACDPDDGNAWMALWSEALRRGDAAAGDRALRELARVEFWTGPVMAFARWTLAHAPSDAIVLVNGDADAVPAAIAQRVEGLRPDVALVNVAMLGLPEAARATADAYGLPLPDSVETFEARYDVRGSRGTADGWVYTLRDHVVSYWLAEAGRLGRPVVGALTLDPAVLGNKTDVEGRGAHSAPAQAFGFDAGAARLAFAGLRGEAFRGPLVSEGDRSPVRRARPFDPGGVVLYQMLQAAVTLGLTGGPAAAEAAYADAIAFAEAAGLAADPLVPVAREWIDAALATH